MAYKIFVGWYKDSPDCWLTHVEGIFPCNRLASTKDITSSENQPWNLSHFCQSLKDKDIVTLEEGTYQVKRNEKSNLIELEKLSDAEVNDLIPF